MRKNSTGRRVAMEMKKGRRARKKVAKSMAKKKKVLLK